jgi:hypothetical protein
VRGGILSTIGETPLVLLSRLLSSAAFRLYAIDVLFVATSTCGTIRGCAEYIRDPGLGAGMRPPPCESSLIDEVVL